MSPATSDGISGSNAPARDSRRSHLVHRVAHAIYGMIVLVALVGDLSTHDEELRNAIVVVAGAALVLVFAHSYSQLVAEVAMSDETPSRHVVLTTLVDQLALAVPATLAVGVFALGATDVISNRAAYTIVVAGSLATLFALGVLMGVHRQRSRAWCLALGACNTVVGLVIIGIEAAAAH